MRPAIVGKRDAFKTSSLPETRVVPPLPPRESRINQLENVQNLGNQEKKPTVEQSNDIKVPNKPKEGVKKLEWGSSKTAQVPTPFKQPESNQKSSSHDDLCSGFFFGWDDDQDKI